MTICEKCKSDPCTCGKTKRTKCEVFSRIVGYYRPITQWNDGKVAEWNKRKTFKLPC